jgi:FkbM family methyltransferase
MTGLYILIQENKLIIHHVGGRAGSIDFPILKGFEKDIINILYEADESCIDQIKDRWKFSESKTLILPYCLSKQEGSGNFHINYDPYSSSIYSLNEKYSKFYHPSFGHNELTSFDYVLGDAWRSMKKINIPYTTLDTIVLDKNEVPSPDFISIDTQGSELDILNGSSRLLETNILAVLVEVEFHQLYKDQPLFGDLCKTLSQYSFDLVDIKLMDKLMPIRGKQGFRGKGFTTHGQALFLKNPNKINDNLQLNKLAFIATVFFQFERSQQCFESENFSVLSETSIVFNNSSPRYLNFIARLSEIVKKLPERSSPLFSDNYSFDSSNERFNLKNHENDFLNIIKNLIKKIAPLVLIVHLGRHVIDVLKRLFCVYKEALVSVRIIATWWKILPCSKVEKLFIDFQLKEQYLVVVNNRIQDSKRF